MKLTSNAAPSHIKITQAGAVSLFVFAVGQVAAFVPSLATYQSTLVSAGTAVIAAAFLVANAVHAIAGSKVGLGVAEAEVKAAVRGELGRILSQGLATPPAAPVPAAVIPVRPVDPAVPPPAA